MPLDPAAQGQPGAPPPGAAPGASPQPGPGGSPMLTPQKPGGQQASGKVKVMVAIHALQLAMLDLGAATPEGQACLEAISKLTKKFGKNEEDSKALMPAEVMQVMQGAAGPGAAPGAGAPPGPPGGAPPTMQ